MHRFFVVSDNIADNKIFITGKDVSHIRKVLRMKEGEQLEVCDSSGRVYLCVIEDFSIMDSNEVVVLNIEKAWKSDTELSSKVYLFQGLPKGDKMDLIIQKAVELGVYQVIPMSTNRAVVKLDDRKATKKIQRWHSISESAAKQSGRSYIPQIQCPMSISKALDYCKKENIDVILIAYELEGAMEETRKVIKRIKPGQQIAVFIGPEGGFDKEEIEQAIDAGAIPISLGKRILRTETAGLAVLSIVMYEVEK